ncbi:MAG: Gfo/Idh/MocA family oxidoreductase [Bacteroidota bacterium]
MNRRELLKSLATIPAVGALFYGWYKKSQVDTLLKKAIHSEVSLNAYNPIVDKNCSGDKPLRIGIIGAGARGKHLIEAAGFIHPEKVDKWKKETIQDKNTNRHEEYLKQEDLNLQLTGVCDVFDINAKNAKEAGANINRGGSEDEMGVAPKRYKTYKELLAANDIDAVIIATPDHWHGTITIEAARAGKHVYCEKPMTLTVPETFEVVKAVKENGIVFQLGHQNRQNESYFKAKEAFEKEIIGKVNLIEVTTNRNSPGGAWVHDIHPDANEKNIDWEQFIGSAPQHEFSLERFFRWRCWWDYSTGLSGDLFTHDYDAMNQILDLGIPHSAISSGGIYYYKDGRTVPDVLNSIFEYPDREFSLIYSASLASNKKRGRIIMGHDGYMDVGGKLKIFADKGSTKYKDDIKNGLISPDIPLYSYSPGQKQADAITSATEQYFASRGLLYSYHGEKRVNSTHLHIKDWIDAIRNNRQPACDIDKGFEEAITAHMGTIAYREKRKVFWDPDKQKII